MNKITRLRLKLLMMLLPLSLIGCIQMEHDLRLSADGSATYRLDYSISEQAISRFRAMFKLKRDLALAEGEPPPGDELEPLLAAFLDPDEAEIRKQLEAFSDSGVGIKSIRQETRAAWRHIELELEIDDLATLADTPFFIAHGFDLSRHDEGQYILSRSPHLSDVGGIPEPFSEQELEQITPLLSGFRTQVRITVPGRIRSTTAFRTTLQTVSWDFDFDRQPVAIQTLLRQHFHVVFDAPRASLPTLQTSAKPEPLR